jgi:hypothetical protein
MLTNDQIERLSNKMGFKLAGVFFKDELPKKMNITEGMLSIYKIVKMLTEKKMKARIGHAFKSISTQLD